MKIMYTVQRRNCRSVGRFGPNWTAVLFRSPFAPVGHRETRSQTIWSRLFPRWTLFFFFFAFSVYNRNEKNKTGRAPTFPTIKTEGETGDTRCRATVHTVTFPLAGGETNTTRHKETQKHTRNNNSKKKIIICPRQVTCQICQQSFLMLLAS